MTRRSRMLWAAALLWATVPAVYLVWLELQELLTRRLSRLSWGITTGTSTGWSSSSPAASA
ncbi:hypothetical protein [Planomonospora sphaerica]|uniref:hypothetical protein n=1 Tax=Planomonospora sphaerica TaxID=161355 RepID=UPI0012908956|nr:hypothetical protein [Planomonospora sphaerica]